MEVEHKEFFYSLSVRELVHGARVARKFIDCNSTLLKKERFEVSQKQLFLTVQVLFRCVVFRLNLDIAPC